MEAAKEGLSHKVGPLPVYGWVLLLGAGGFATYYLFFKPSATTANSTAGGFPLLGTGGSAGNSGTPIPAPGATPNPTPLLANNIWLETAVPMVATALGMDTAQVRYYLRQYLLGREPQGSSSAVTAFESVIQSARQLVGWPASPPTATGQNPYATNASYLQDVFAFLPAGTPGSVRNELTALFAGTTTTISQAAADALEGVRRIVGFEPTSTPYTVLAAARPAPQPAPPAPGPAPAPAPAPVPGLSKSFKPYSQIVSGAQNAVRYADIALGGGTGVIPGLSVVVKGAPDSNGTRQLGVYLPSGPNNYGGVELPGWLDRFGNITFLSFGNWITKANAPGLLAEPVGYGTNY